MKPVSIKKGRLCSDWLKSLGSFSQSEQRRPFLGPLVTHLSAGYSCWTPSSRTAGSTPGPEWEPSPCSPPPPSTHSPSDTSRRTGTPVWQLWWLAVLQGWSICHAGQLCSNFHTFSPLLKGVYPVCTKQKSFRTVYTMNLSACTGYCIHIFLRGYYEDNFF